MPPSDSAEQIVRSVTPGERHNRKLTSTEIGQDSGFCGLLSVDNPRRRTMVAQALTTHVAVTICGANLGAPLGGPSTFVLLKGGFNMCLESYCSLGGGRIDSVLR